jgi:hypothetical protein
MRGFPRQEIDDSYEEPLKIFSGLRGDISKLLAGGAAR